MEMRYFTVRELLSFIGYAIEIIAVIGTLARFKEYKNISAPKIFSWNKTNDDATRMVNGLVNNINDAIDKVNNESHRSYKNIKVYLLLLIFGMFVQLVANLPFKGFDSSIEDNHPSYHYKKYNTNNGNNK